MRPTIILYFLVLSNLLQAVVNTEPQQNVNFNRYLGRWYEQARFENWFEEGMEHVYTDYLPLQNGAIQVINHGTSAQGYAEQARGRAFIAGKGVLDISFVWPYWWFRTPYKILYVDPDYQSALISCEGDEYLWLLTRKKTASPGQIDTLRKEAQRRGFDTSKLRFTNQK